MFWPIEEVSKIHGLIVNPLKPVYNEHKIYLCLIGSTKKLPEGAKDMEKESGDSDQNEEESDNDENEGVKV